MHPTGGGLYEWVEGYAPIGHSIFVVDNVGTVGVNTNTNVNVD